MSRIDELIAEHCPKGVRHGAVSEVAGYSSARVAASELDKSTFVGVDNLVANKGGRIDATYLPNTSRLTSYQVGDVLIGNIRPYLKKVWLATNSGGCSGDVLAIRIKAGEIQGLLPKFLYYLLSSDDFFAFNMKTAKGAKMPRGDKNAILNYRIPVPPLEVQQEIVRILDQFKDPRLGLEAELEAELEARRRQYHHYRDSLLTSNNLLPLNEFADFKYGYTATAKAFGDFRFIRITDIDPSGKLADNDPKFVDLSKDATEYLVEPGDLLMARTGATFGKTMLANSYKTSVYASFLIRIRLNPDVMIPSYYWHFAQSGRYWAQANALVSRGGQHQFNANSLKRINVPIPPLEEQRRIVEVLDKFDALVNDLSIGLPAELAARRKQYEYYRDKLLTFSEIDEDFFE